MIPASGGSIPGDTTAAASRLEVIAPGYLARVRTAAHRLAHRDNSVVTVQTALGDIEDTYALDLEVPTLSSRRAGRLLKVAVTRLTGFYLRYLTVQVAAFSAAVNRFAGVLAERTDQLEAQHLAMGAELRRLGERIEGLEGERDRDAPA